MLQSSSFKTRKCISNKHINWVQFDVDQTLFNWTKGSPNYKNNSAISFYSTPLLNSCVTPVLGKIMSFPITWCSYIQSLHTVQYKTTLVNIVIVPRMLVSVKLMQLNSGVSKLNTEKYLHDLRKDSSLPSTENTLFLRKIHETYSAPERFSRDWTK